jgi:site-specific recombinase XerD
LKPPIKIVRNIDGIKYFTEQQIRMLRASVQKAAKLDQAMGRVTAIREWMVIDLITSSGLRVAEAANVRCGDLKIGLFESEVFVRCGKGARSRHIQIPDGLKQHLTQFLKWKRKQGEAVQNDAHLLVGQRGAWTVQAIQQVVKKHLKAMGLYERGKSVHSLRHSFAYHFYRRSLDIRALQILLGHASIQTTQIYTHASKEDIQELIRGIWT